MKFVALKFRGIGPYKDEYAIDFTRLTKPNHLFLIDGETGSGKSTIFDAICYALYGRPTRSGDKDTQERIRSRFLTETDESWVSLIFSVNGRYYRVTRRPAYKRPSKRGKGLTEEKPAGSLVVVDDGLGRLIEDDDPLKDPDPERFFRYADVAEHQGDALDDNGKMDALNSRIASITNLDADQFTQVIFLPQGKFDQFLNAKAKDRVPLLSSIFTDTAIYKQVSEELTEMAKEQGTKVGSLWTKTLKAVNTAQKRAQETLGNDNPVFDELCARTLQETNPDLYDRAVDAWEATHADAAPDATLPADEILDEAKRLDSTSELSRDALLNRSWGLSDDGLKVYGKMRSDTFAGNLDDIVNIIDERMSEASAALDVVLGNARERHERASLRSDCMGALHDAQGKERALVTERRALASRKGEIDEKREELHLAQTAQPVVNANQTVQNCESRLAVQNADVEAKENKLTGPTQEELSKQLNEAENAQKEVDRLQSRIDAIDMKLKRFTACDEAVEEMGTADARSQAAAQAWEAALEEEKKKGDRGALMARLTSLQKKSARQETAQAAVKKARERLNDFDTFDDLRRAVAERANEENSLTAAAQEAESRHLEAVRRQAIAELAGTVRDGEPCPLCGSTEHPRPAVADMQEPNAIAETKQAVDKTREDLSQWQKETTRIEAQAANIADSIGEQTREQAEAAARAAQTVYNETLTAAREAETTRQAIDDLDAAAEKTRERHEALIEAQAEAKSKKENVDALQKECAAYGKRDDLMSSRADLEGKRAGQARKADERPRITADLAARKKADDELAEARNRSVELQGALGQARKAFRDALESSGFADWPEAERHARTPQQIAALAASVKEFDDAMMRNANELESRRSDLREYLTVNSEYVCRLLDIDVIPASAAVFRDSDDDDASDFERTPLGDAIAHALGTNGLAKAQEEKSAAEAALQEATNNSTRMKENFEKWNDDTANARKTASEWCAAATESEPYTRMADMASGNNSRNLNLESYALQQRFLDVLENANEILRGIHDGIYQLELGVHEGNGNAATGIPLVVYDDRTHKTSPVQDLSGGESFFISLALALGLSQTVQDESGGIDMDTLFIDEGFGSLSANYLEEVLDVLTGLHRDIGIISHVEMLRERIPERIEVRRLGDETGGVPSRLPSTLRVIA